MNKKYIVTSTSWAGEVELLYTDATLDEKDTMLLGYLDMRRAELSEKQHIWFLRSLPRDLAELEQMLLKAPNATLTEVPIEISFEMFWKRYGAPANSKKKKAQLAWNRMKQYDQVKAYNHIFKYERNLANWQTKMYAESYLNAELWNN